MSKKLFLILTVLFLAQFAAAQVSFVASADKTSIDITEDINLTVRLDSNTANITPPQMPSLPNFNIYSSGESRNASMVNGKVKAQHNFYYILSPRFAGKSTIGPFTIKIDGKEYKTEPIEVEVSRASAGTAQTTAPAKQPQKPTATSAKTPAQPPPSKQQAQQTAPSASKKPDFFMTAEVSKRAAWLNEQITLKIRFYQAQTTLGNPQYNKPKMEGLVSEDIKTTQEEEIIDGKRFIFTEFKSALFGIIAGQAVVESASVDYVVSSFMGDVFDVFFSGAGSAKRVMSEPIKIEIKPLPKEGRPQSFFGAVGTHYYIKAAVDNNAPHAGEPITFTITVAGNGNMRAISDIPPPDLGANFRVYETTSSSSTKINGDIIAGNKVYKTVIVPRVSGKFTIPGMEFAYFDTNTATFRILNTEDIILKVAPASDNQSPGAISFAPGGATAPGIEKINEDISYIKERGLTPFLTIALTKIADAGPINYIPFLLIFAALLRLSGINIFTRKSSYRIAAADLKRAKTLDEVSSALSDYIAAKQGSPIGIMTVAEAAKKLNISEDTRKKVADLWQSLEMLKYAPSSSVPGVAPAADAAKKALKIIKEIEGQIK